MTPKPAALAVIAAPYAAIAMILAVAFAPNAARAQAYPLDTAARNAVVVDAETGAVLLDKRGDQRIPPASMSKLMTAAMVFEALKQGRLAEDDRFPVSKAAFRKEGSTMYLNLGDEPTVLELLRGVIVQSGNDACIVLAEALAGSEAAFAARMTERGKEIGLTHSTFANATGLPDEAHLMSALDLARIALHIIKEHQRYYPLYSETNFEWAGVDQKNRNPLLYIENGGDGLKTGYTEEAGYGIVGSAKRGERRVIAVLAGLDSIRSRSQEVRRALAWAFREFRNEMIAKRGEQVAEADVWIGDAARVPLVLAEDVLITVPFAADVKASAVAIFQEPMPAPIKKGQPLGVLRIEVPGLGPVETPLVAGADVGEGGALARISAGAGLLRRWVADQATELVFGGEAE